jgi:uncharacterized membrane protein YhiD involved in acid resistance
MSGAWKGVALTLITIFIIILAYNLFNRSKPSQISSNSYEQQVTAYYEYLEEQSKKTTEYFKKLDYQIQLSNEINSKAMENQQRFSKLIDRWEKQSDNFDRLVLEK